jgi:hypothetical protein
MSFGQYSYDGPAPRTNPLASKPRTGKRQRQVFPSSEIPHLWAHKTQESARNQQGNFYFDGDTIYSYGSHYPLAKHVSNGKQTAILINTSTRNRGGSCTTSSQRSAVRQAIPANVRKFDVSSLCEYTIDHEANLDAYLRESKDALGKAERSRKHGEWDLSRAFKQFATAKEYGKFFAVKVPSFAHLPKGKKLEALKATMVERLARAKVKDAEKDARREARRAEARRIAALELPERIAAWRNGSPVDSWSLRNLPAMLRVRGSQVETSLGATVPVDHAARALKFVNACVAAGREYVRNGHTEHVGHYTIDWIEANGTLHAGCHVISYEEIQLIAPQLEVGA